MEIGNINQGSQSMVNLNVSTEVSKTSTEMIQEQTIVVGNGRGAGQQSDTYQADGGQKNLTDKDVEKAVGKLNKLLEDKETHAEYEFYGKFNDLTVRIVNTKTKEVVQELPPKKIIDMIDKLCELAGMFVDKKA